MRTVTLAFAVSSGLAGTFAGCTTAQAHDWYPVECCAQQDCVPARSVDADGRGGDMTVVVGDLRILVPAGFPARTSPDSRVHVCFRMFAGDMDGSPVLTPICLFLPAQS